MALNEAELARVEELRGKHGEVKALRVNGTLVVVRKANVGEMHRFKDKTAKAFGPQKRGSTNGPSIADAERELALSCIVEPMDRERVLALVDEKPGLLGVAASHAEAMGENGIEEIEGN